MGSKLSRWINKVWNRLYYGSQTPFCHIPWVVALFAKVKGYSDLFTSRDTDIVIEGFPRSGNSYSCAYFELANSDPKIKIANHLHVPANIIRGVQMRKPVIVLYRRPLDAVVSQISLGIETNLINKNRLSPYQMIAVNQYFRRYIKFYRALNECFSSVVLCSLEEVARDFSAVVKRVNFQYKTNYDFQSISHDDIKRFVDKGRFHHVLPTNRRKKLSQRVKKVVLKKVDPVLLMKAESVYDDLAVQARAA